MPSSTPGFSPHRSPRPWHDIGLTSHAILAKAAKLKLFGKSPVGFFLRLNRRVWDTIPLRLRNFYPIRTYGTNGPED
jgi:hypothetical protein